jgi:hypothetical protein
MVPLSKNKDLFNDESTLPLVVVERKASLLLVVGWRPGFVE